MRAVHRIPRRFCAFMHSENVIVSIKLVDLKRELKDDQDKLSLRQEIFLLRLDERLRARQDRLRALQAQREERLQALQAQREDLLRAGQAQREDRLRARLMSTVFLGRSVGVFLSCGLGVSVAVVRFSLLIK